MTEVDPKTCPHSVLFNNICVNCGAVVHGSYQRADPNNSMITISEEEAKKNNEDIEKYLVEHKKLALVIDLDKTLIDTAVVRSHEEGEQLMASDPSTPKEDFIFFQTNEMFVVRLRPHVREFLRDIAPFFRMQIYTLAQTSYADKILRVLDPNNEYFHRRIFSRVAEVDQQLIRQRKMNPHDSIRLEKDIKLLFPYSDRFVLVLDDTPGVWYCDRSDPSVPQQERKIFKGLVQLKPFVYFNQPNPRAPATILQQGPDDDILIQMKDVLIDVRNRFYADYDPEESHVLISLSNRKMLTFDKMYFLFTNIVEDDREDLTKRAEEFGAVVLDTFQPYLTHILVGSGGTNEEIQKALDYEGIYVIHIQWFIQSSLQYCRIDENKFKLTGIPCPTDGELEREDPPEEDDFSDDLDKLFDETEDQNEENANEQKEENEDNQQKPKVLTMEDLKNDPNWLDKIEAMGDDDLSEDSSDEAHK